MFKSFDFVMSSDGDSKINTSILSFWIFHHSKRLETFSAFRVDDKTGVIDQLSADALALAFEILLLKANKIVVLAGCTKTT